MNEVVKFAGAGTGLMTRDDMARALNNMSMEAPRVGGEYQYLKLTRAGEWEYGQEETLVEEDSQWAVNPVSLQWGYISWDANQQVEGEVMVPITSPLPNKDTLRVKGSADGRPTGQNGWQYQQAVNLVCISGEDAGKVQAQYKQSSVGSQKLFKALVDAISGQVNKGSDAIVPIIVMKVDSYKHKKYGKINNPIWEIVEWRTMDDGAPAGESEQAEEPAPKAARTRSAAPAQQAPQPPAEGSADEDKALEAEYQQEAAQQTAATPRRRVRR